MEGQTYNLVQEFNEILGMNYLNVDALLLEDDDDLPEDVARDIELTFADVPEDDLRQAM